MMGKIDWLELDHSISFKRVALRRQTLHRWGHRIVKFNANKPSAGDQPISLVNFSFFFFLRDMGLEKEISHTKLHHEPMEDDTYITLR